MTPQQKETLELFVEASLDVDTMARLVNESGLPKGMYAVDVKGKTYIVRTYTPSYKLEPEFLGVADEARLPSP